jgi:eukaryotic-like serine/threonine-protein kinase
MTTTTVGGRYELGPRLGSGGMADVLEAVDRRLDRRVAVKLMRADVSDPRARQRFEHEASVAAALTHPNVVAVYDLGEHDGVPYIVMELVEGTTLAALLADHGALAPRDAALITDQVLRALEAAHAQGLVHRDVKPANVLITRDGTTKLADFGIAKALATSPSLTQTGQVIGTPRYLSPEQVAGHEATERSDLYAVGLMLYEMLAGEPPFPTESFTALAAAHQHAPVPSLADRRPGLPAALVTTAEHALAKDPGDRFADAREMRRSLAGASSTDAAAVTTAVDAPAQTALLPDPTAAPSTTEPSAPREGRRARRLWPAVAAGVVIGALVLAGILLATGGNDDPVTAAATSTTAKRVTTSSAPPTTTTPTTLAPQSVADLVALLAADPSAYGEKGEDLLARLESILERPDGAGKDAARLIEEIDGWVNDGQLSPLLGEQATAILTPIADTSDKGRGVGNGKNDFGH